MRGGTQRSHKFPGHAEGRDWKRVSGELRRNQTGDAEQEGRCDDHRKLAAPYDPCYPNESK